jgi:hypothetical protein
VTYVDEIDTSSAAPAVTVPAATPTEDLVTALCGTAMMLGVLSDSWAHNNLLAEVQREGFFTPWHGLLYTGFAATAAWTFRLAYRRRSGAPDWWRTGWPAGYRTGAVGAVIFLLAGGADLVWHSVFGIEANLTALLSPSHLALVVGAVLLLSSPMRSWWANGAGRDRAVSGILSVTLAAVAATIFLGYATPFYPARPLIRYAGGETGAADNTIAALGLAGYVVTTAALVYALLLVHRRRPTLGAATGPVIGLSGFAIAGHEFPRAEIAGAAGAIVAAIAVDGLLWWLDRHRGRSAALRLPIAGALLAALVWSGNLLGLQFGAGIHWSPELWGGVIASTALVGALLGGLATAPARDLART